VISRADDVSDLGRAAVKYGDELADTAHAASKADDAMGVIRGADGFADSVVIQGKRIDVNYLENNKARIAQSSPIDVPKDATAKVQRKNGYLQVKYEWSDGTYKYQSRWHTRNPGAPTAKESYWVTERRIPGKQYGKNMRAPVQEILVGDNQWISYADWDKAKSARRSGTLTKQQEEWLDNGHWTDFTQY